jgi:hypothetical protein
MKIIAWLFDKKDRNRFVTEVKQRNGLLINLKMTGQQQKSSLITLIII